MGYTKVNTVRENNEFAIRGDIIDIFNTGKENPIRIYLNNDKIEKFSFFDALTQRNKSLPRFVGGRRLLQHGFSELDLCRMVAVGA